MNKEQRDDDYKSFFVDLEESKYEEDLKKLFKKYKIKVRDKDKYPYLEFSIGASEIDKLKESGIKNIVHLD